MRKQGGVRTREWGSLSVGGEGLLSSIWHRLSSSSSSSSSSRGSNEGLIDTGGFGIDHRHLHHEDDDPMSNSGVASFVHGLVIIGGEWGLWCQNAHVCKVAARVADICVHQFKWPSFST
jgi:hypothetical protein